MSAEAIAKLQGIWEQLVFARVRRTIAREPEDVLSIEIQEVMGYTPDDNVPILGSTERWVMSRRLSDIPAKDRWRARIHWRHFYGFTDDGIYFQLQDARQLDLDILLTCDFGTTFMNHEGSDRPKPGDWICGTVIETEHGKRFDRWFILTPELRSLITLIRAGKTRMSEAELAPLLISSGYPDTLWALVRLVMFDNVQAFVDQHRGIKETHPCFGRSYGPTFHNGSRRRVDWTRMWLSVPPVQFVHGLSHLLDTAAWWETWKNAFGGNASCSGILSGTCLGCQEEARRERPWAPDYYADY